MDSRVALTANALADRSLAAAPGDYLGAEDELLTHLGVSRPTLRQAARLVASDRLLEVRRGLRGGFYAARPEPADVIRAPARYLRLKGATINHVHSVTRLIGEEVAAAAARSEGVEMRRKLAEFKARIDRNDDVGAMIRAETELARLLAQMSANPAAELFMEISYTFGRDEQGLHFYQRADDRERTRSLQHGLCDAVLAGDADVARLMMRRRGDLISEWLAREQVQ